MYYFVHAGTKVLLGRLFSTYIKSLTGFYDILNSSYKG